MARTPYRGPALIGDFVIDCVITETHTRANEVTDFPVERGPNISDGIREVPAKITLEFTITNTPLGEVAGMRDPDTQPTDEFLAYVDKLFADKLPISITTELKTYDSLAIENLTTTKSNPDTGDAVDVTAQLKVFTVVDVNRVAATVSSPSLKRGFSKGTKPTNPVAPVGTAAIPTILQQRKTSALAEIFYHGRTPTNAFDIF